MRAARTAARTKPRRCGLYIRLCPGCDSRLCWMGPSAVGARIARPHTCVSTAPASNALRQSLPLRGGVARSATERCWGSCDSRKSSVQRTAVTPLSQAFGLTSPLKGSLFVPPAGGCVLHRPGSESGVRYGRLIVAPTVGASAASAVGIASWRAEMQSAPTARSALLHASLFPQSPPLQLVRCRDSRRAGHGRLDFLHSLYYTQ